MYTVCECVSDHLNNRSYRKYCYGRFGWRCTCDVNVLMQKCGSNLVDRKLICSPTFPGNPFVEIKVMLLNLRCGLQNKYQMK